MDPAQEVTPGGPIVTATPLTRRHSRHRGVFRRLPLPALSWTTPVGKLSAPCSFEFSHIRSGCYGEVWGFIWIIASQIFLKIFECGPLWKSLLNLLQHCFCSLFWFFGHEVCGILAPRPRIKPTRLAWGRLRLNHWTATEVPASQQFKGVHLFSNTALPKWQEVSLWFTNPVDGENQSTLFHVKWKLFCIWKNKGSLRKDLNEMQQFPASLNTPLIQYLH